MSRKSQHCPLCGGFLEIPLNGRTRCGRCHAEFVDPDERDAAERRAPEAPEPLHPPLPPIESSIPRATSPLDWAAQAAISPWPVALPEVCEKCGGEGYYIIDGGSYGERVDVIVPCECAQP